VEMYGVQDPVVVHVADSHVQMMMTKVVHEEVDHMVGHLEIIIQDEVAAAAAVVVVAAVVMDSDDKMMEKLKFSKIQSSFKIYQKMLLGMNFSMLFHLLEQLELMIDQVVQKSGSTKIVIPVKEMVELQ